MQTLTLNEIKQVNGGSDTNTYSSAFITGAVLGAGVGVYATASLLVATAALPSFILSVAATSLVLTNTGTIIIPCSFVGGLIGDGTANLYSHANSYLFG